MQGVDLLGSSDRVDHATATSDIQSMQHLGVTGERWIIGDAINDDQYLRHLIVSAVFHDVGDILLSI